MGNENIHLELRRGYKNKDQVCYKITIYVDTELNRLIKIARLVIGLERYNYIY